MISATTFCCGAWRAPSIRRRCPPAVSLRDHRELWISRTSLLRNYLPRRRRRGRHGDRLGWHAHAGPAERSAVGGLGPLSAVSGVAAVSRPSRHGPRLPRQRRHRLPRGLDHRAGPQRDRQHRHLPRRADARRRARRAVLRSSSSTTGRKTAPPRRSSSRSSAAARSRCRRRRRSPTAGSENRMPAGAARCWPGARWLCFIDADVRAARQLVAAAVDAAERQQIDMLSLHPFQELGSFWERLMIPAGLLIIACAKDLAAAASPGCSAADANGQFMLIRRQVYFDLGGHAAVASAICEDRALALGRNLRGTGFACWRQSTSPRPGCTATCPRCGKASPRTRSKSSAAAALTLAAAAAGMAIGWAALALPAVIAVAIFPQPAAIELCRARAGSGRLGDRRRGATRHRPPFSHPRHLWHIAALRLYRRFPARLPQLAAAPRRRGDLEGAEIRLPPEAFGAKVVTRAIVMPAEP